ncbi:hypothetical protein PC129_g21651 [Phytophthora cactorum]|uniref:Uncharacterized protein n=2 Tax=Phytophthora cactorum TaxID=29920 RepID=A0A329RDV3_9STRA|nr:hypothetical protein Pcac1_g15694 [Phytophthora cactorum]KAG2773490.1 hypothetical protein Pcac1_g15705 [Phytophthora cactorum]KAG2795814.1 hypothetical protein PC111_g21984 [Phytophthora cactorum]KAG2796268.1 hypothetical protein PC112_g22283 [Phytophthora cactorum]KAG2823244.1 hypothetical protein PC113_g22213 [Phytophthora cactorum]
MDPCVLRAAIETQRDGGVFYRKGSSHAFASVRQSHFRARKIEDTYVRKSIACETLLITPARDSAVHGLLSLTRGKRTRETSTTFSPFKRQLPETPDVSEAQSPATDTESLNSGKEVALDWTTTQGKHQRERIHANPTQHRTMEDDHTKTLEEENQQLRGQIENLQRRRRLVSTVRPPKENVWNVALVYFRVFRNGLQSRTQSSRNQFEFLKATMAPDMVFNTGRGPEAMTRTWKCISLWFQDAELELEGMEKGPTGSLIAATTTRVTVTERTLRNVFPHLWVKSGKYKELAEKLLGQRIVMRGSIQFDWDSTHRRVRSVIAQSDLLRPMLGIVGSLEDVTQVFDKAIISPDFQWRSSAN